METKLYVGNLSYTTSEDELRTMFSQAGTVVSAVVMTDHDTGASKGFGFVEMASPADARQAIKMFNAHVSGRTRAAGGTGPAARRAQQPVETVLGESGHAVNLARLRRDVMT